MQHIEEHCHGVYEELSRYLSSDSPTSEKSTLKQIYSEIDMMKKFFRDKRPTKMHLEEFIEKYQLKSFLVVTSKKQRCF